ncbi:MAG: hypothetical protein V4664_00350 [Patescibacteria group bacterium]
MDQEIQEIRAELKKVSKLTEENSVILHAIQRRAKLALLWSFFRWMIIIGIAIGSFYYIQPYLEQLAIIYQKLTGAKLDFIEFFRRF